MIFTVKKASITEYISVFMSIFLLGLIVSAPGVCATGAKSGLKICAQILVPSLFPFAVPVIFLIGTNTFKNSKYRTIWIFVLSMLGGYPIGSRLISQLYSEGNLNKYSAQKMLPFCVNAGPAFIIIAVGRGILKSVKLGYILFFSHVLATIITALIFLPKPILYGNVNSSTDKISFSDNFVSSIYGASSACISICGYVIFFSVVNEYILYYSRLIKHFRILLYFTEVTSALTQTKNIFVISFLLGFAGISIWMQIFSFASEINTNIISFAFTRILHGGISTLITFFLIKVLKVGVVTIGNGVATYGKTLYSNLSLSLSLLIMAILFIISIISKKHSGNIITDMV